MSARAFVLCSLTMLGVAQMAACGSDPPTSDEPEAVTLACQAGYAARRATVAELEADPVARLSLATARRNPVLLVLMERASFWHGIAPPREWAEEGLLRGGSFKWVPEATAVTECPGNFGNGTSVETVELLGYRPLELTRKGDALILTVEPAAGEAYVATYPRVDGRWPGSLSASFPEGRTVWRDEGSARWETDPAGNLLYAFATTAPPGKEVIAPITSNSGKYRVISPGTDGGGEIELLDGQGQSIRRHSFPKSPAWTEFEAVDIPAEAESVRITPAAGGRGLALLPASVDLPR